MKMGREGSRRLRKRRLGGLNDLAAKDEPANSTHQSADAVLDCRLLLALQSSSHVVEHSSLYTSYQALRCTARQRIGERVRAVRPVGLAAGDRLADADEPLLEDLAKSVAIVAICF
jgi:hypothetical protein